MTFVWTNVSINDMVKKLQVSGFDWDRGNSEKCKKHGVPLNVIENLFRQNNLLIAPDLKHSDKEKRYFAIGRVEKERPVIVIFTIRNSMIRPISARFMHKKEVKKYEKINS